MRLVGICGAIRGGKSTIGQMFSDYCRDVKQYSFADALKEDCAKLMPREQLGWTGIDWSGKKSAEGRSLLQTHAEKRRSEDVNYWMNQVKNKIEEEKPKIAVITDTRYMNELNWIAEQEQPIIYVRHTKQELVWLKGYTNNDPLYQHGSETSWRLWLHCNPYKYVELWNDSDLTTLKMQVERFFSFDLPLYPSI